MQLKRGQIIEFDIDSIAFGGQGVGRYEGRAVFVNGVMGGDRVRASLRRIKEKFMEAELVEVVRGSSDRVAPRCEYFDRCGGCSFQFMPYEKQLEIKKQQVVDAFERIGGVVSPPVEDVVACEEPYYYRNKMEFSFGYDGEMNFALGMHLPGRRYDILNLENCYLMSEKSAEILNFVRGVCVRNGWLPFKFSVGEGFLRLLTVREGKRTGELMVVMATSDDLPEGFDSGLEEIADGLREFGVTSFYWSQIISKRGVPRRVKEQLVFGKKFLSEVLRLEATATAGQGGDELKFEILPQAFFQVNTYQAEKLYAEVIKMVEAGHHKTVFDLYCGTGTIGMFVAKHAEQVWGIELVEDAVRAARENASKNAVFNIDFFVGDVDKVLHNLRERPDLIIVDPPRAGIAKKVVAKLSEFGANEIIYVSCNPATLARDCALLREYGYRVEKIVPVDMFPHTYHIENVCLLKR
ncbi:23S rRNA (uracil(1939)-C(5))-methyltransferase RlmD [Patescibacteria group bacterium]|nr:23S rRNA (uracil(1939)-C(5))-methyltransferase RlmD [Patescibacteria group bacterium]